MQKLLSLPPNLVDCFYDITNRTKKDWFCTSDPVGARLGSGGGTAWLLDACRKNEMPDMPIAEWIGRNKRILLHAGGQSRRLPGYAPSGKILTPIPVFRWERGQRLSQDLLSLQLPLYERIMQKAPDSLHTLIASGDVYIRCEKSLQQIPEVDVVCYGLWVDPALATNHGVFVSDRKRPEQLDFMLQKPLVEELGNLAGSHLFLMDIGIWLLSDRAVELLMKRSHNLDGKGMLMYDLYSEFGLSLGNHPRIEDKELNALSVAVLPLPGGEFYHYGTSRELISSTLAVQNLVHDQRAIMQRKIKPHPAIFIQNADVTFPLTALNSELWIENSCVTSSWKIANKHIITGIPENNWNLALPSGVCADVVPVEDIGFVARPYGFYDVFKGDTESAGTLFIGQPLRDWAACRGVKVPFCKDIQNALLFPVCSTVDELGEVLRWMISEPERESGKKRWMSAPKLSANDISVQANLSRLFAQREVYRLKNWPLLAKNHDKSVFYQLNLADAATEFVEHSIALPDVLPDDASLTKRIHDSMFRARVLQLTGQEYRTEEKKAFSLLRDGLIDSLVYKKQSPELNVHRDQIVWSRSPVRIDLAGGWTDTPPFCLYAGGNVVNMAIELNGQPPLQVYIKPGKEYKIILRSIDLGAMEVISSWEQLKDYTKVGSPFSIPKAALSLAGFAPEFSAEHFCSLEDQLKAFGAGLEVTLLAAIPAGSGLGTSSILAATVLGAISDFCGLAWDKSEIGSRALVLEQLLTTGGGWQDQYGGILHGVKLLQTGEGFNQNPEVRWLPQYLFTDPDFTPCHLLYYTGITRTAKDILAEIVRGMFLNNTAHLNLLTEMKAHALNMFEMIQRGNFASYGQLVSKSWEQNKALDPGTNPPSVELLIKQIKEYTLGYKLPGAGGGGYLYMVAKDPEAALRIRKLLTEQPQNQNARFVDMNLSTKGLQISRS